MLARAAWGCRRHPTDSLPLVLFLGQSRFLSKIPFPDKKEKKGSRRRTVHDPKDEQMHREDLIEREKQRLRGFKWRVMATQRRRGEYDARDELGYDDSTRKFQSGEMPTERVVINAEWVREKLKESHEEGGTEDGPDEIAAKPLKIAHYRRVGLIVKKMGMTVDWDKWGVQYPLTALQLQHCQLVQKKTVDKDGYCALQLGAGTRKFQYVKKPLQGHFRAARVAVKRVLKEFRVWPANADIPRAHKFDVRHFVPGQYVDVQGVSKGKGTVGVMEKWGFSGGPASHGCSKTHRAGGSISGGRKNRVWRGKKMAGRWGNRLRTVQSLLLYKIDVGAQVLYVHGAVPGKAGSFVYIRDALKHTNTHLPVPTYFPNREQDLKDYLELQKPLIMVKEAPEEDPFYELEEDDKKLVIARARMDPAHKSLKQARAQIAKKKGKM